MLTYSENNKYIYGRKYNVEYELGNGKRMTFSNVLENVDGTYFWFMSEEDGLDVIRQDRVLTMTCLDRRTRKETINENSNNN